MKLVFTIILSLTALISTTAQTTWALRETLNWSDKPIVQNLNSTNSRTSPYFDKAVFSDLKTPSLPVFNHRFPLKTGGRLSVDFKTQKFNSLSIEAKKWLNLGNFKAFRPILT